jgi:hypothetical protein
VGRQKSGIGRADDQVARGTGSRDRDRGRQRREEKEGRETVQTRQTTAVKLDKQSPDTAAAWGERGDERGGAAELWQL